MTPTNMRTVYSKVAMTALLLFLGSLFFMAIRPAIAQTATNPQAEFQDEVQAGLTIFTERCANCHGPEGLGDGLMAADLPNPPTPLGDPAFLRTAVPTDLYAVINNGRVERGMPPFGSQSSNPLSADDRWRLVAALYHLSAPAESVVQGQEIYTATCQACHGEMGNDLDGFSLKDPGYWLNVSDQTVFDSLAESSPIVEHHLALSSEEQWAAVTYTRAAFGNPAALFQPLAQAALSGELMNGTTGETLGSEAAGLTVQLRAFTEDLDMPLAITTTLGTNGRYHFDLTDVSPAWFFQVQASYQGIEFASDFGQLSHARPDLELPLTVYETTTDPAVVTIDQLHIVMDFVDNEIQVNELYVLSNSGAAVFIGESGRLEQGTARFALPADALNLTIQRGLGSLDSFMPTNEFVTTPDGWAATMPVRPGQGTLALLVQYTLPYRSGMSLNQPLYHNAAGATLILRDVGVSVAENGQWVNQGQQTLMGDNFLSYFRANLPAGSSLDLTLNGRSRATPRDGESESTLLVGGGFLLLALAAAVYLAYSWRQAPTPQEAPKLAKPPAAEAERLLLAIAELDDAHEKGEIPDGRYQREREKLKASLRGVWGR